MTIDYLNSSLGELARIIPGATRVFHDFRLDFCCGGHHSLAEAARRKHLDPQRVIDSLHVLTAEPSETRDWASAPAAELIDHTEGAAALLTTDDEAALLFRHTRELLTNVIKHAKADTITVEVQTTANEIHISVQDNGVGFDVADIGGNGKAQGRFGLFSITESMVDMGGRLEIDSAPGQGCRAVLRMPVRKE